jgi:hypothetical protein
MRLVKRFALAAVGVGLLAGLAVCRPAEDKPKYTIEDVMKKAHDAKNNPDAIFPKVVSGKASDDDKKQLVELYTALGQNKPPKGDADDWKTRTDAMVTAAKAVADNKDGSIDDLKKAVACMDCHKLHRGK